MTPLEACMMIFPFTIVVFTLGYFFGKVRTLRLLSKPTIYKDNAEDET